MKFTDIGGLIGARLWRGDPDCQSAHDELLTHLRARNSPFLPTSEKLGVRRQGNFGEHIAFRIGYSTDFSAWHTRAINGINPLSNNSTSGVDIMWLFLSAVCRADDVVVIQETKTTNAADLNYAYNLTGDYKKLFALNQDFTLQTRLQALANELEVIPGFNASTLHRIISLGQATAALCSQVQLVPTVVHDLGSDDPKPILIGIRSAIAKQGWAPQNIKPWSIALSDLIARLDRIAHGQA